MRQRNKHLPPALSDTADVVLHNGDLARKAVLITQPLEYPLRCVTLLLRTILILFQDTVDNTDERIELRADRRPRPDITRWHRIAQHLPDRARVDPKTTSRFALAQTLNHYRVANPPIQFHSLHPPPFAPKCKGLSLTEFCSGATRLSGRFSEGLLLRRSQAEFHGLQDAHHAPGDHQENGDYHHQLLHGRCSPPYRCAPLSPNISQVIIISW